VLVFVFFGFRRALDRPGSVQGAWVKPEAGGQAQLHVLTAGRVQLGSRPAANPLGYSQQVFYLSSLLGVAGKVTGQVGRQILSRGESLQTLLK